VRTIAVGDVHGCIEEFDELLDKTSFRPGVDRLVLLGDLMDRGPDAPAVVRRARELGALCVIGNHDDKHLRWRKHEQKRAATGKANPMRAMRHPDADAHEKLTEADFAWLASLPTVLDLGPVGGREGRWLAVHAGFEPKWPLAQPAAHTGFAPKWLGEQRPDKMLRVRYVTADGEMVSISNDVDQPAGTARWGSVWTGKYHVVYGHHATSLTQPQHDMFVEVDDTVGNIWHRFGLDTGCCFGGCLTAMDIGTFQTVSVPAKRQYADLWHGDDQPRSENSG